MKRCLLLLLVLGACSTPPPPAPSPQPEQPETPAAEKVIGTVRVTATTLNVRREASAGSEVVAQVRKGEKLSLLAAGEEWDRVRLGNGDIGFVAVQHVIREGGSRRRGCPADADYAFVKTPTPAFSEDNAHHGIVTVEASVDAHGEVTSTRVVSNTTGDEALGVMAEREIRQARFTPPIRNCAPRAFIFTYKRSF